MYGSWGWQCCSVWWMVRLAVFATAMETKLIWADFINQRSCNLQVFLISKANSQANLSIVKRMIERKIFFDLKFEKDVTTYLIREWIIRKLMPSWVRSSLKLIDSKPSNITRGMWELFAQNFPFCFWICFLSKGQLIITSWQRELGKPFFWKCCSFGQPKKPKNSPPRQPED